MSLIPEVPQELRTRPFTCVATGKAVPGKEDRTFELLKAVHESANSSAEPGMYTYRINRSLDKSVTVMYEEYANYEAFEAHAQTEAYKQLIQGLTTEGLVENLDIQFYEELLRDNRK